MGRREIIKDNKVNTFADLMEGVTSQYEMEDMMKDFEEMEEYEICEGIRLGLKKFRRFLKVNKLKEWEAVGYEWTGSLENRIILSTTKEDAQAFCLENGLRITVIGQLKKEK